jgi:D-alanyl-lipoteichoic acid acyltransferase DltB (MBOAT superfamily)
MYFIPIYIVILAVTIVIDYFAGILIYNAKGNKRKKFLFLSIVANLGVLAFFKYYGFLNENISLLLTQFNIRSPLPNLSFLLPVGLSFHTFQAMSYTIEVYK